MVTAAHPIPLDQCLARPPDGSREYPLLEHLWNVGKLAGDPEGSPAEQLLFLAGFLHDVGKARRSWQERLLDPNRRGAAGPHAFVGAAMFAALALRWIGARPDRIELEPLVLWTCRDIADHHGALGDLELDPPWRSLWSPGVLNDLDVEGVLSALKATGLSLANHRWPASRLEFARWIDDARRPWAQAVMGLARRPGQQTAADLLRHRTARLIAADRYDVGQLEEDRLTREQVEQAIQRMEAVLAVRAKEVVGPVTEERQRIQLEVLNKFRQHPHRPVYTLVLPTGSGKTLTALRVALEACRLGGRQRIVYAGPYLSVVEQAAQQIGEVSGLSVLQHHHLAQPPAHPTGPDHLSDDERNHLVMESWQAPVVAVTFNQLFRALFPARAQHTLRIPALFDSFVIVDEPQIVHEAGWSLFTHLLAAACKEWNLQALIMTATMPPWTVPEVVPFDLSVPVNLPSRYTVEVLGQGFTASDLAERLVDDARRGLPVAAILNTIANAASVLSAVQSLANDGGDGRAPHGRGLGPAEENRFSLPVIGVHGFMTPLHKRRHIRAIRELVEAKQPVIVVATQALEAGVDLDFARLYRARPILPSVLQAAGRVNRHGRRSQGDVLVFDFVDERGDSRPWVYKDGIARDETDRLLQAGCLWEERVFEKLVPLYFEAVMQRRPGSDASGPLSEARKGKWSAIAGIEPFEEGPPRIPVFVPHDVGGEPDIVAEMRSWGCETPDRLYELYRRPGWLQTLSHRNRRRFLGLIEKFVVPVSWDVAQQVADIHVQRAILPVVDLDAYTDDNGFGDFRRTGNVERDIW